MYRGLRLKYFYEEIFMSVSVEWLEQKFEEIKNMQEEIERRIDQLTQQKLMNVGAVAMINEMKKELSEETQQQSN